MQGYGPPWIPGDTVALVAAKPQSNQTATRGRRARGVPAGLPLGGSRSPRCPCRDDVAGASMEVAETAVATIGQVFVEPMLVAAMLGGALVGLTQYFVMRPHVGPHARSWILAVTSAWALGSLATLLLPYPLRDARPYPSSAKKR